MHANGPYCQQFVPNFCVERIALLQSCNRIRGAFMTSGIHFAHCNPALHPSLSNHPMITVVSGHQGASICMCRDLGVCTFVDYAVDTTRSSLHSTAPMFSPQWTASQAMHTASMPGSQATQAVSQVRCLPTCARLVILDNAYQT